MCDVCSGGDGLLTLRTSRGQTIQNPTVEAPADATNWPTLLWNTAHTHTQVDTHTHTHTHEALGHLRSAPRGLVYQVVWWL
jgi:hypothetical protein